MTRRRLMTLLSLPFASYTFSVVLLVGCSALEQSPPAGLLQVGGMHEAIGMGRHQSRVSLDEIVGKPHFYGVGAVEALQGEVTVLDSVAIATAVAQDGRPRPLESSSVRATMLAGQSIRNWIDLPLPEGVSPSEFDEAIGGMAAERGIDVSKPFVFVIEGEFREVRLHIINGACPVHARKKGAQIEKRKQPFALEAERMNGTLVGVYAVDSAGSLTHRGTRTHAHLIYIDEDSGDRITGHIEQGGVAKGANVKFPEPGER